MADEVADLEGLEVEGVVIAAAEGVGAEHDPAFDLVAKALLAGGVVHVDIITWVFCAMAVMDAVEAGEIAGGFGGGDEIVGRDGVLQMGQLHVNHLSAHADVFLHGVADELVDLGIEAFKGEEFLSDADL